MSDTRIDATSWGMLLLLSLIWGCSYLFVGIAVQELSALLIVLARVVMAAAVLLVLHWVLRGPLPKDGATWRAVAGMSIINNVLPFTLIAWGQHHVPSGLSSVLNATAPMFGAAFMAMAGAEPLVTRKIIGLILGLAGVAVIRGLNTTSIDASSWGIAALLAAAVCYGLSSLWAKRKLTGIAPLTSAAGQLTVSSVVMAVLAFAFDSPAKLMSASTSTLLALAALAILSTSIAYLIFFNIIKRAGASAVLLVTMLIPVSAIIMGALVLHERLTPQQLAGTAITLLALVIIDGRAAQWFRRAVPGAQ